MMNIQVEVLPWSQRGAWELRALVWSGCLHCSGSWGHGHQRRLGLSSPLTEWSGRRKATRVGVSEGRAMLQGGGCGTRSFSLLTFSVFTKALCESRPWLRMPQSPAFWSPVTTQTVANRAAAASAVPASHSTGAFDPLCFLSQPGFVCWLWPVLLTHSPHRRLCGTSNRVAPFVQYRAVCRSAEVPCSHTRLHLGVLERSRQCSSSLEGPC